MLFVGGHPDRPGGGGHFSLRDEHLGDKDCAGGCHDDRREEVFRVDPEENVGRHDASRDVGHPGGHDRHQLGTSSAGEEGTDSEGGFGLAHEDAGGDVGAFGAGGPHRALHDEGDDLDDLLHKTNVVKDSEEGADEDDGRQDGEGEDAQHALGVAKGAKDKRGAVGGMGEQTGDEAGDSGEDGLAVRPLDDKEREKDL